MGSAVPSIRIATISAAPPRPDRAYVLYWMLAARRAQWNFGLDRAVEWGRELKRPLLVLEALRCDYPYASDRLHRFVLDGMADNARAFAAARIGYYPYVERAPGEDRGLFDALAGSAAAVVADAHPMPFVARLLARAGARTDVRVESVDSNGLLPLAAPGPAQVFATAYAFRRFLQRALPEHLRDRPRARVASTRPFHRRVLPDSVVARWPATDLKVARGRLGAYPIDHGVHPVRHAGGSVAAGARLREFVRAELPHYVELHRHPDEDVTSRLSPYLHFGHLSAHEAAHAVLRSDAWTPARLAPTARGVRTGWWGVEPNAEAFLDELVTWRELGFNMASRRADADQFESLPPWAITTLQRHAGDRRSHVYDRETFERAATHDEVWNAAQRQLRGDGRIHNYLRMLWGKKIVEWTRSPEEALAIMLALNDRWAVDGRDPNSVSGIFWVLGRYDRPWAPDRPVFGTVRYMSSASTIRKLRVRKYLAAYGSRGD